MQRYSIRDKCHVNTNEDEDTFVGIKCEDKDISINFPLGFDVSKGDKGLRKDITLLMHVLAAYSNHKDSSYTNAQKEYDILAFPFHAYLEILYDFFERGYFKERETQYTVAKRGKINWSRTIKTQSPVVQDGNIFYLEFVAKKNTINDNEMITLIHEFCVYDSFEKIGWLFTDAMPARPRIKFNKKLFVSVIKNKRSKTFNDKNKSLFRNMIAVVEQLDDSNAESKFEYGTYRFEYVWEKLIDRVFGIENKADYFPKTTWNVFGNKYDNASLEPDTIMVWNNNVYVLDSKYYKFGRTKKSGDLPESTSINKQITYGEYIAETEKYREIHGKRMQVYNVFMMPFNKHSTKWNTDKNIVRIGEATSNWKSNEKTYERVQGVVIDIKHVMGISVRHDEIEIKRLVDLIEEFFDYAE